MHRKASSYNDLAKIAGVMERVFEEHPEHWPYGLSTAHYNPGDLYVIEKEAKVVGFTGWQTARDEGHLTGYYSVGVLPEHRRGGLAKQAVSKLLDERAGEVDRVRALIKAANAPSRALADSLGVQVKVAGWKDIFTSVAHGGANAGERSMRSWIPALGGALGSTAFFDQAADPSRSFSSTIHPGGWDKERALMGGLNALLGGAGGVQMHKGEFLKGLGAFALAPTKDLAIKGVGSLNKLDGALEKVPSLADSAATAVSPAVIDSPASPAADGKPGLGTIAALAALGIGGGALLGRAGKSAPQAPGGRIKVTLPTKSPGDAETSVDLPFDQIEQLTPALRQRLERDIRRRLYAETSARTYRRPGGGKQEIVDPLNAAA